MGERCWLISTCPKDCQSIFNYCKDLLLNGYNIKVTSVHSLKRVDTLARLRRSVGEMA